MDKLDRDSANPSCHFVAPRDGSAVRLEQTTDSLKETLRPFIVGRGKAKRLEEAVSAVILHLRPMLKLPKKPELGATVMTEAATRNKAGKFTQGPKIS